ncbi:hypothetical protein NSE01_19660 [Novosphingobium sediminis]|uniref:Uncharacterized protein n=1 Tax=Novosphingobium sediminis TaxID=707214 RepID=A0A512AKC1_9SPHN|nr:hypothetical protein NSE01_19660 [Novosphingobium sediminis]
MALEGALSLSDKRPRRCSHCLKPARYAAYGGLCERRRVEADRRTIIPCPAAQISLRKERADVTWCNGKLPIQR